MNASERSIVRAIRGPITLITIGVLFAFNNFTPYRFDQTWPVILIVFGLLSLLGRGVERAQGPPPGYPQPGYPAQGYPAAGYPPSAAPGYTPQSSYAQSPYAQPPAGTPKGGFGTSAPARENEPGDSTGGAK